MSKIDQIWDHSHNKHYSKERNWTGIVWGHIQVAPKFICLNINAEKSKKYQVMQVAREVK